MENSNNSFKFINTNEEKELDFKDILIKLNDFNYVLGTFEIKGFKINRKYIHNYYDQSVKLYYTSIKYELPKESSTNNTAINLNIPISKLCIIHGFGHHSSDFLEYALYMAKCNILVYLIDLRGHGYSGGVRFDWSIQDLHQDIITLIKESEKEEYNLPLYLLGHSLGGGLVSSLFINNPYLQLQGIILSSPLLGCPIALPEDPFKSFILNNYGNKLKDLLVSGNINVSALTKVDSELPKMINDAKNIPICTPNSYRSIMKMYSRILENCRNFNLPCLIFHGDSDKITNHKHSIVFYENIRSKNKEIIIVENGYHELYKDTDKMSYFENSVKWIIKNKNSGKTDRPFPTDITLGPPKKVYLKLKLGALIKLIFYILYIFTAIKLSPLFKSKLAKVFWPVGLIGYLYNQFISL